VESVFLNARNFNRKSNLFLPHWHLVFLNTKIDGRDDGLLSLSELKRLKDEIMTSPANKKIAIVMHHHPAPVGTPLIDNYILQNNKDFWDIVTGTKVELIICGHVHGDYRFKYNNVMIESSPATCLQWEKGTKVLKTDMRIGYKIYHFEQNGYQAIAKMW
jgi:Icc protein